MTNSSNSALGVQTLLGNSSLYQTRPSNFLMAFLGQTLGIVLAIVLLNYFGHRALVPIGRLIPSMTSISFSPTMEEPSGGGSGGDRSKTAASTGVLPAMTMADQLTPPEAVPTNLDPKLPEPPSLMAITDAKLPQLGQMGNPLANLQAPLSNGEGEKGGIGNDCCGGVGSKPGRGIGDDIGNIYHPGVAGVTLPSPIYDPDPDYTEEARRAKHQGSVILWLVVDALGQPRNIRLQRSLGMGLDEKAMATVGQWRFKPATLNDQPVAVQINVEVTFRLF